MSVFYRYCTIKKRTYLYREERWREGRKMRSRSRCLGPIGSAVAASVSSPLFMIPALPFMIAYDLVSGNRVERLRAQLAKAREPKPQTWTPPPLHVVMAQSRAARAAWEARNPVDPEKAAMWSAVNASFDALQSARL